jgi:hypothetical protein
MYLLVYAVPVKLTEFIRNFNLSDERNVIFSVIREKLVEIWIRGRLCISCEEQYGSESCCCCCCCCWDSEEVVLHSMPRATPVVSSCYFGLHFYKTFTVVKCFSAHFMTGIFYVTTHIITWLDTTDFLLQIHSEITLKGFSYLVTGTRDDLFNERWTWIQTSTLKAFSFYWLVLLTYDC